MSTYTAHVIDTTGHLHSISVQASSHRTVKAAARKMAQTQGIEVRYVESIFING